MRNPLKILISGAGPEIIYLVIGPGLNIRSILSREKAAQLLEQVQPDIILGPQNPAVGSSARELPEKKAA